VSLARGLRNFMWSYNLSPETPLASDVAHTTRSVVNGGHTVANAGTTASHHLATGRHESAEYRL